MKSPLQKWISTALIAALCAGFIVVPERDALADDRPHVDLVAILVDSTLMGDSTTVPVRDDLKSEFSGDMQNITLAARVRRYADDIQAKLDMSKVMIIPVSPDEQPWKIQEALSKLYTEGDGSAATVSKLKGVVLIGNVPLPLVTKSDRSYVSMYPYTDFDDPLFTYDFSKQQFLARQVAGRAQPEVWHGVIPYPIAWEQYIRDQSREQELSQIRIKNGIDAYTKRLDEMRQDYNKAEREELAQYLDKNHSFYSNGSYSLFSKKAILMDLFREFQSVNDFGLAGYQAYLDNWDNKSYMRYTREWLADLQKKYFQETAQQVGQVYATNADGSTPTPQELVAKATAEIQANNALTDDEKRRQIQELQVNEVNTADLQTSIKDTANATNVIPDVFTRAPIENFLQTATEVFGPVVSRQVQYFVNTGRWSLVGDAGDRDAFTLYKIVQMLDENSRKDILEVNNAMEKEVDAMLNDAASKSMNMQLDLPIAPINYFGRYTSFLYKSPSQYLDIGDLFNAGSGSLEYVPGHWFFLDLKPTPAEGTPLALQFDADSFIKTVEDPANAQKYVPYTGQKYQKIVHHMGADKEADVSRMTYCAGNNLPGWSWIAGPLSFALGSAVAQGDKDKECSIFFDNPSPAQLKYIELYDPRTKGYDDNQKLQIQRYETTKKIKDYISTTKEPDLSYVSQQIIMIGDTALYLDWGNFLTHQPYNWSTMVDRLQRHEDYLHQTNAELLDFQVIVHVVDMPFTAAQCTIYLGGAPETATVGDQKYPLYLRGATSQSPERVAANSFEKAPANGNNTNLQNSSAWRQTKVNEQVLLSLSTQEKRIRQQEMEIAYVEANPPRGDNVTPEQMKAWEERLKQLKLEKQRMEDVRDQARTLFTKIWSDYYSASQGDTARFGDYLNHVGTMASQSDLSQLVEANRLYDQGQDATIRVKNPDSDTPEQKPDAASIVDPAWYGYTGETIDRRPDSFTFPDWFDFARHGYWGGCSAPNLQRVQDISTKPTYKGYRLEMENVFQELRDRHLRKLQHDDKGALGWLQYLVAPVLIFNQFSDSAEAQSYYLDVLATSGDLYKVLDKMMDDDSYQPSIDSSDAIEASVGNYKRLLQMEKDTLGRDLSEQEYNVIKTELRVPIKDGMKKLQELQTAYQKELTKKPEDRPNSPEIVNINPKDFGVNLPAQNLPITDSTSLDTAKETLYDLVQAKYESILLQNPKIQPATIQAMAGYGGRAVQAGNNAMSAIDGEITSILSTSSIYEALTLVGLACDPQRAMEPILDPAGGKAQTDPGYLPLRTTEKTVKISEVNTLAPTIVSGNESWAVPKKPTDINPPRETYAPAQAPSLLDNTAPTWKAPVLQEYNANYPQESPNAFQTYRDDYPKTRNETLTNPAQQANSYDQGWEYSLKGYTVTQDQSAGSVKDINAGMTPENSYLACLRYATYGMEPTTLQSGQPSAKDKLTDPYFGQQFVDNPQDQTKLVKDALQEDSSDLTKDKKTGWPLLDKLMSSGVGSVPFKMGGADAGVQDQNVLLEFLKEFERMANSETGGWKVFPDSKDNLDIQSLIPFDYKGKWDFKFEYVMQTANKLESYFQTALRGNPVDANDPAGRRTLYSLYGVRRIATVIPHKEPTNETIAQQVQSLSATSLPVNNPRYVDFYLYEPIPEFNKFGEITKWDEYNEHVSIPYINFFRAFPDEKRFAYALDTDHAQFKKDISSVEDRMQGIMQGFNNYLTDYLGRTSLSGPSATVDTSNLQLDVSRISDDLTKREVTDMNSRLLQGLSQGAKTPQQLQDIMQQSLAGSARQTSALETTHLEDVNFDDARFKKVLAGTSLGAGQTDPATAAEKKLAFSIYWQHMTLAEKYKYVIHNYLTSAPDPEATDMDFWKQTTQYTDPVKTETKVGYEAGTIILQSDVASAMQIPLESIQGKKAPGTLQASGVLTASVQDAPIETPCDQVYAIGGGNKYGVPLENWGNSIGCWATHLWPLRDDVSEKNALSLTLWGKQAASQAENFAQQTGRTVENLGDAGNAILQGGGLVLQGAGAALDAAGKWLNDTDQDGLSTLVPPTDHNLISADADDTKGTGKPNGFRDGQDAVRSLLVTSGREAVVVNKDGSSANVQVPAPEKQGIIPYGDGNPLEIKVRLLDKDGLPLLADNFDYVRLDIVPEDAAKSVVTIPTSEQLQRVDGGMATFRVFAKNGSKAFGTTRMTVSLVRQKLPNSSFVPEPVPDITANYSVIVSPEQLNASLYRIPCTAQERTAGTCARGDVRSSDIDSIYSTNETSHLLAMIATDKTREGSVVDRSGKATLRYYKTSPDPENLYKKAMGGKDSIEIQLDHGTYSAALAVPKESGKYFIEVTPEESLNLAPVLISFLVVDTTYTTMKLEADPAVAVEGQTVTLKPHFTNLSGEEVDIGLGQASIGIPRNTPFALNTSNIAIYDGLPGGDTDSHLSIDITAGKVKAAALPLPDSQGAQKDPYTLDLLMSKIAPLSQIAEQAGSLDAAVAQGLVVRTPLQVYPKGALVVRAALTDGSSATTIPALTASDTACVAGVEANISRAFNVNVELRDRSGKLVPYTGDLTATPEDFSLFTQVPQTVAMKDGKGTIMVTPSRKSGTTKLIFDDADKAFAPASISVTITPGKLAALRFTTQVARPLEASAEKSGDVGPDSMLPLRYAGLDMCGNPVDNTDNTTIALDVQPAIGDGSQIELLPIDDSAAGAMGQAEVNLSSGVKDVMKTQRLAEGRNTMVLEALNFRGEVSITLRALTTDGNGKTVINTRIQPDNVTVPVRLTLRKELLQSLEPNILYTNLLGGPYGDVTQKDYLGGWWMLTGKTQVVTTSTVADEAPANLAKVLPNGAIDLGSAQAATSIKMFAEPKLEPNMPFTVDIKDSSDGAAVMQVRYNVVPFLSGALFENYATDITVDQTASLAPGMYVVPAPGVTTRKDLLAKSRSIIRFFQNDKGASKEAAILADNLQFFQGSAEAAMPVVAMDTSRLDIMTMRLTDSAQHLLATIYVKLDPQRVFPADGDYEHDIQLSLDTVKAEAVSGGAATVQNGNVTLADAVKERIADAEKLAPQLAGSSAVRYVRQALDRAASLSGLQNGIFTRSLTDNLLKAAGTGDTTGLYVGDRLVFPLRNLQTAIPAVQAWLGANTLQYQLQLAAEGMHVAVRYASNGNSIDMLSLTPVYGAKPLTWNNSDAAASGWNLSATRGAPYQYNTDAKGLQVVASTATGVPGTYTGGNACTPAATTQNIVLAGILPTGETFTCFDSMQWERYLVSSGGRPRLQYVLKEQGTTTRTLTEAFLQFGADRAFRTLVVPKDAVASISSTHQAMYITTEDDSHVWNQEQGQIIRKEPLPGNSQGLTPVLSLTPAGFLQVAPEAMASGLYRLRLDTTVNLPTMVLDELRNGTWTAVVTLRFQPNEAAPAVKFVAAANKEAEQAKNEMDTLKLYLTDTSLVAHEEDNLVRLTNASGTEFMRLQKLPLQIEALGDGIQPELLDISHDRFQFRLKNSAGAEIATIDARYEPAYTRLQRIDAELPDTLRSVPGLYMLQQSPLLRAEHATDRTSSRILLGFEELMTINKTGGQSITRPDLLTAAYAPEMTSGQFISFGLRLFNTDAMALYYSMASLPFDLRILTYLRDQNRPALETAQRDLPSSVLRPRTAQSFTGYLSLVGKFLDLHLVLESLTTRNQQLKNTTLSLPASVTDEGYLAANLHLERRDGNESRDAARLVFVPAATAEPVRALRRDTETTASLNGLAILTEGEPTPNACARTDERSVAGTAVQLRTCTDASGVRIVRHLADGTDAPVAFIRNDGAYAAQDAAYALRLRFETAPARIYYSLTTATGADLLTDIVVGSSSKLQNNLRRGTPELDRTAAAGSYISYIATAADPQAAYRLMEDLPGVPESRTTLQYCSNQQDLARTCQTQLRLGTDAFLQRPDDRFVWQQETALRDTAGFTLPVFGYIFQPGSTRIATMTLLLNDTPLTTNNIRLTAKADAKMTEENGQLVLRRGDRVLLRVTEATGRLESVVAPRILSMTPTETRATLVDGTTEVAELAFTRTYAGDDTATADTLPARPASAGLYITGAQNLLQVAHAFPDQNTEVRLGFDRLLTLRSDGSVDLALPDIVKTILPATSDALRLTVNRTGETLDLGTSLVAFPLNDMAARLQSAAQTSLQTTPFMRSVVDNFGNIVTSAALQQKGTSNQLQAGQMRSVFAPTKPVIVYSSQPATPSTTSLPSMTLNPGAFYNAVRSEAYTVIQKNGNLYFIAPSANPYWTSTLGRDDACSVPVSGGGIAGAILADGTRLVCDPLHTIDLGFDANARAFTMTLRTREQRAGASSIIGTVYVSPGDMARFRTLMGSPDFQPEDTAANFAPQGLYGAINPDYIFQNGQLRLTKGDKAALWSAATSSFMSFITGGKAWDNTADRTYITYSNIADTELTLTQRRLPLAWNVVERRDMRFTDAGTEDWRGEVTAGSFRMTLTDPAATVLSEDTSAANTPAFTCAPDQTTVTCAVDAQGNVVLQQHQQIERQSITNGTYAIPAVVFRKDAVARWLETGLWNGTTRFDAGDRTGLARLELYGADGRIRAVVQYRPALQNGIARVTAYAPGTTPPVLSTSQPEVQVLLANNNVRLVERPDFYAIAVDEPLDENSSELLQLADNGEIAGFPQRLQNLDALSYDGTTVRTIGSVGQLGFSVEATRDHVKWLLGNAQTLLPSDTKWTVRSFQEVQQAAYTLGRGEIALEALKDGVALASTDTAVSVSRVQGTTTEPFADITRSRMPVITLRSPDVALATRTTATARETLLVEKSPATALIHIAGNPRVAASTNALTQDPFTAVSLIAAGAQAPSIEQQGSAYIQPRDTNIRLTDGDQILVEQLRSGQWTRIATINKRTLSVTLADTNTYLAWDRDAATLHEGFITDVQDAALARLRQQNMLPDLQQSAALIADFSRNATTAPRLDQRADTAERSLDTSNVVALFGNRLTANIDNGLHITASADDIKPFTDILQQEIVTSIMTIDPQRLLVSQLDTGRFQLVAQTLLPAKQSYTVYPAGVTDPAQALATITRTQPLSERYTASQWRSVDQSLTSIATPGLVLHQQDDLVSFTVQTGDNSTTVRYGFDDVGRLESNGTITPVNDAWRALLAAAKNLRDSMSGTIVQLLDIPYIQYQVRRNAQGYENNGVRNTILVEMRKNLGNSLLQAVTGSDRPTALQVNGQNLLQWSQEMVQTASSSLAQYSFDPQQTSVLKFNVTSAAGPLASLFIQTVADTSANDGNTGSGTDVGNLPVDQMTSALDVLGGTGIYVQIRAPEKGDLHLAYQPSGASTNNMYAVALQDASLPLLAQDQVNPQTVGVEDALQEAGDGIGYTGDFKNMLLFAGGSNVGESTLPYMSEALINIGDPVISLKIQDADRTNEYFTDDIGTLVYTDPKAQIQQMVLYDIDQDGRDDIVFTDGDGILQVIHNEGGSPIRWKFLGGTFQIPEGIRELLVMQLQNKKNLAVALGKPTQGTATETKDAVTAVTAVDKSFVEIKDNAGALTRCKNTVPSLGSVTDANFGDIDGDGTDDLVALTSKNEIKAVHIDPSVDCDTSAADKQRYTTTTVDTIGMKLGGTVQQTANGTVPAGFTLLADGDVFARFNGALAQTWDPSKSICPQVDPRQTTPVYPRSQVPVNMPANPDMVFVPEISQSSGNFGSDDISKAVAQLSQQYEGSNGSYFTYQGNGEALMRMLVSAELPYIRSGGQALAYYDQAFQTISQSNPFSCLAGGFGAVRGIANFAGNLVNQVNNLLGVATGPLKSVALSTEMSSTRSPSNTFFVSKFGKDINGGNIQQDDTIAYAITISNHLGVTKNIDIGDRFQQGTQLLKGSVFCQEDTERIACMPQDGGGLFGLYVPNIEVKAGKTVTINYQAKMLTTPMPLTLQLLDAKYLKDAITQDGLITLFSKLNVIFDGNVDKQKVISVTTPAMANVGSFVYWRQADGNYAGDILKQPTKANPIMQIPVIGKLLESFGLSWDENGQLDPNAKRDTSTGNVNKQLKSVNNLLMNAFLSSDRDRDGLIDLWDDDIDAPAQDVGDVARLAASPSYTNGVLGAISDAGKSVAQAAGQAAGNFDKLLTGVNNDLKAMDCQTGGCSLVPADLNTAFLAPGASLGDVTSFISDNKGKDILRDVSDQTGYAVFAWPTASGIPWPANGTYDDVKLLSQVRVYLSATLSGRFALTACGGPYIVGMLDLPVPTGLEPNKNCYTFILPDFLNIREFCQQLANGLSGLIGGVGRIVASGGYVAARAQKARSITGLAAQEPPAAFIADQFVFQTDRFQAPLDAKDPIGKTLGSFMKDFQQLNRGAGQLIPPSNRQAAFPAFVMDWLERQIHEVLAKLTKLPTITLILPDPTLGFTRPLDPANDTLEKRQATGDLTTIDMVQQRVTSLSDALAKNETEVDLANKKAAETEQKQLIAGCEAQADKSLCEDPVRLNQEVARLDSAALVGLDALPANDALLSDDQFSKVLSAVDDDLAQSAALIATLPDGDQKKALQDRYSQLKGEWEAAQSDATGVNTLPRSHQLLADIRLAADPETYRTTQLKAYNQLKGSVADRTALANCNPSDPVGCALQSADQSVKQFVNGVSLNTGTSNADIARILNSGVSSDQLLRTHVRGFSEVMSIIGALPFVSVRLQDVVFYYPWLPPDRISEFLYQLQAVKNQSLESFNTFYSRWASCFNEVDAQGNAIWNPMLPPSFTVRDNVQAGVGGTASGDAKTQIEARYYCLAAARVGADAWAGLQGIDSNINRIKDYGNIMNSMKEYLQWKTYITGRLVGLVSGVLNQIIGYTQTQNKILQSWRETIRSITNALQTFQVLVDVFADYRNQCVGCQNQRGTDTAQLLDLIGNFIQLDVIPFPKWPDLQIDLSNINFRYQVVIPNIRFVPQQVNLPRFTPIILPELGALPQAQLGVFANQGLNISLPVLPALPTLPRLPDLPLFRFPSFPDLPPPPKIPQLNVQVRLMVQTIGKILSILCLLQRNVLPTSEARVRSYIESMTTSPLVTTGGQLAKTPTYEATLDRIRISSQVNITFDTNRPFGQDTYMWIFNQAAFYWNGFVRSVLLNPAQVAVRDLPQALYGTVAGFVTDEVRTNIINNINTTLSQTNQDLNGALQKNVILPVTNFRQSVQEAIQKKQQQVSAVPQTEQNIADTRKQELLSMAGSDKVTSYLISQLLDLQESIVTTSTQAGDADPASYVPDLQKQIALLASDDSGLPQDMRDKAVSRLQKIVDNAKAPAPSIQQPLDVEQLPYVAGWRSLEKELQQEHDQLGEAERTIARMNSAQTLEEFKSVLQDTGMLAQDSFNQGPVASLGEQDSRNTESQRILDSLAGNVAVEVPMDVRDATMEKKIQRDTPLLADSPEVGASGAAVASNVDASGLPMLAQSSVVASPAVTNVNAPTTSTPSTTTPTGFALNPDGTVPEAPKNDVRIGPEEEGAILVQLPDNGGVITLMHYIPPAGLPVQIQLAPLRGDEAHPDAVVSMGSDIYIKYNQRSTAQKPDSESYTGSDRIREVQGLASLMPVLPAVQGPRVTGVDAQQVTIQFDLPSRTRMLDDKDAFTGNDARYILRTYNQIEGRRLGETPTEYVILPVTEDVLGDNQVRLQQLMADNMAAMPEAVRNSLKEEATRQGLPAERVLLGVVSGTTVSVTLPILGRETPLYMTIVPRVATDNGNRDGLVSEQLFAHPQRGQDTTAPVITVQGGENQVVPLEAPLVLKASAEDAMNDVVSLSWDTDLLKDTDLDGDTGNDRDVVCSATTPCTVPLTTMTNESTNKAATPALNAPDLALTWQAGDRGIHTVRVFATDALGNTSSRDVTLQVLPTEVRIDEYNPQSGVVRGSIYPPQAGKKLQLLRVRDKNVSELHLPSEVVTDGSGHFEIQGVTSGQGTATYTASGTVMEQKP